MASNLQIIYTAKVLNGIKEEIHTFQEWKRLGYKVNKGEKCKIRIGIWKEYKDDEDESRFFIKNSAFFGETQVSKI